MKKNHQKKGFTLMELPVVRKRGFTLIELLIASAIFASIMVIVVGVFSWAAGYNNKLHETRRVAQNSRMIMSDISTQVRLANGKANLKIKASDPPVEIGEVTILQCPYSSNVLLSQCLVYDNVIPEPLDISLGHTRYALLVLKKDQNKAILYQTSLVAGSTDFRLIRQEETFVFSDDLVMETLFEKPSDISDTDSELFNESTISVKVVFAGYGPSKTSRTQQPYIEFYIIGQTRDYDNAQPNNRAKFHAKTLVESRDYN